METLHVEDKLVFGSKRRTALSNPKTAAIFFFLLLLLPPPWVYTHFWAAGGEELMSTFRYGFPFPFSPQIACRSLSVIS